MKKLSNWSSLHAAAVLGVGLATFAPSVAHAGGFWITDRGARPMSRGFAMVAGSDDPQSLWYNPAGLGWSGTQLQLDATYTFFDGSYTRFDGSDAQTPMPEVDVGQVPLPIPGGAMSIQLGDDWNLGLGVFAPNAVLTDYDQTFDDNGYGAPCNPDDGDPGCVAPQRYSLLSMKGTALANLAGAIAWRPNEHFAIGVGAHIMVGVFQADQTISACDGAICTHPEDPEWDAGARLHLLPFFDVAPTAGITYDAGPVRVGGSFIWYPRGIQGTADMSVRLPGAQLFNGAFVEGDRAKVNIDFPFTLRAGVEIRPGDVFRLEGAVVWERWSSQDAITIDPQNVWIRDLVALDDYQVGPISIPRNMNDMWSFRLGGSIALLNDRSLVLSAGGNYETSTFDDAYLTPLTLDARKITVTAGLSYRVLEIMWIDLSFAHVFMDDPTVRNSAVPQVNSIRPPSNGVATMVGNGQYEMEANIVGAGLRFMFHGDGEPLPPVPSDAPAGGGAGDEESLDDLGGPADPEAAPAEPVQAAPATSPAGADLSPDPVGEEPPVRVRQPRRPRTETDPNPYR